jgi:hypothetical protein
MSWISVQVRQCLLGNGFLELEVVWTTFYSTLQPNLREELQRPDIGENICEQYRSYYNSLVRCLIPDVFQFMPAHKVKQIRNFAKQLDEWLRQALHGYSDAFIATMIELSTAFGHVGFFLCFCMSL